MLTRSSNEEDEDRNQRLDVELPACVARLERLTRRVDVVRGPPMSVKAIDAMEKKLRVKLGAEYRTFLQETGSLEEIFLERAKSRISR